MGEELADRRSRVAAVSVILACALSVVLVPLAGREVFTLRDHTDYFQPLRWFTAAQLRTGNLPLWNPYSNSGEPWLANPQTGVFYPPAWLFVALPFDVAYNLFLFLHLFILGFGAFRFFSRFAARAPALTGAVALTLAGPVLSLLDVQNNLTTFAWVPWVLGRALEDRKTPRPIRSALLLAMAFLAGEPFFAAVAAAMYALLVRRVRTIALAGALAFGFSAVQLLPFVDWLRESDRSAGFSAGDVLRDSMPFRDWLRVMVPARFVSGPMGQQFIRVVYAGAIVVALALLGGAAAASAAVRRRGGSAGLFFIALLAISAILASGPTFLAHLPMTLFRYPARLLPFAALAIAGLAVLGLDKVPRRRWLDALIVAAVAIDLRLAATPLLDSAPFRPDRVPYPPMVGRDAKIIRFGFGHGSTREPWIAGYLNLYQRRFDARSAAPVSSLRANGHYVAVMQQHDVARESGVGYVLARRPLAGFQPIANFGEVFAQRDPRALPLAYVREDDGRIRSTLAYAVGPDHAFVVAQSSRGGVLVLTQLDGPGWNVEVDGQKAEKLLVHGVLRAVRIGPGRHEVGWKYRPLSLIAGAVITLLACVVSMRLSRT